MVPDDSDNVFLNRELSLFEAPRGGRSQSLSAVPRDGEGSAFVPTSFGLDEVKNRLKREPSFFYAFPLVRLRKVAEPLFKTL